MKVNFNSHYHQITSSCKHIVSYAGKMIRRYPGRAAIAVGVVVASLLTTVTALLTNHHHKSFSKGKDSDTLKRKDLYIATLEGRAKGPGGRRLPNKKSTEQINKMNEVVQRKFSNLPVEKLKTAPSTAPTRPLPPTPVKKAVIVPSVAPAKPLPVPTKKVKVVSPSGSPVKRKTLSSTVARSKIIGAPGRRLPTKRKEVAKT